MPEKFSRRDLFIAAGAGAAANFIRNRLPREGSKVDSAKVAQEVKKEQEGELRPPKFISGESLSSEDAYVNRPEIFGIIDQAWIGLEDEKAGFTVESVPIYGKKRKGQKRAPVIKHKEKLKTYNILLAATDSVNHPNQIEFINVDQNGAPNKEGFKVVKGEALGIGTAFEITAPQHHVVLALKRALQIENNFEEEIYTPYTEDLDTPVIRKKGYDYLVGQLIAAQEALRMRKVVSKAFPGKLLADAMPMKVALLLSMSEHIDPFVFKREAHKLEHPTAPNVPTLTQANAEREVIGDLTNRVLTVVGANREYSYIYAYSNAGAGGLFQFIPNTYESIARKYPEARLVKGFRDGMDDHQNSAMASLLLFDSDLSNASPEQRRVFSQDSKFMGEYLAAAYNGGAPTAAHAIRDYGANWQHHLKAETQPYVDKFRALWAAFEEK